MKIVYCCYAHLFTSMGVIANNVIRELDHAGFDVQYKFLNTDQDWSQYPPEVQKAVTQQFDPNECTEIMFSYPDIYPANMNCKIKVGYTGADSTGWYATSNPKRPQQTCNEFCHYMLTPSKYSTDIMKKCGVEIPIEIFPHGINLDIFKPIKRQIVNPFTFVYTGELTKRKGTQNLIEAFCRAFGKDPNYKLILRANTHMHYLEGDEITNMTKDYENIELVWKNAGQEDIASYLYKGHVYVYPSLADWFGMIPLEALATGMPVIATSTNGYYEFIHDKILGVQTKLVDIGNKHPYLLGQWNEPVLISLMAKMGEVEHYYDHYSLKAFKDSEEIRENFSWKKVTEDYLIPFLDKINQKHFKPETKTTLINKECSKKIPKLLDRIKNK